MHWGYCYTYTLTEGMARISDAAEVNALACRRSDTRPATTPPMQCSMCIKHSKMHIHQNVEFD